MSGFSKMNGFSHRDSKGILLENKIDELFDKKTGGYFIELGAADGQTQSNTAFLEKSREWTGLLIEPCFEAYTMCKYNRPKSLCVNYACVSDDYKEKTVKGDFTKLNLMSSIDGTRNKETSNLCEVKAMTLGKILDTVKKQDVKIDFLSLDCEGYEHNILKGLNLEKHRPRFMLIELYTAEYEDVVEFLKQYRYKFVCNFSNYNKIDNPHWDGTHNDYLFEDTE
jgi:FkbM family methyltransferase